MVDWKPSLDNLIHRYSRKTQLRRHPSEMRNGHKTRSGQVEIRPAAQCAEQCDRRELSQSIIINYDQLTPFQSLDGIIHIDGT